MRAKPIPQRQRQAAATIKDVAREAGVSVASVSRVINGHGNVLSQTRERILEVVERLRYAPHLGARELITRRTRVIGVILPDLYGEFFSELIRGIDGAAREHKLHLLLSSSHGDASEMVAAIQSMRGRVEGLLVMAPHLDAAGLRDRLGDEVPMVFMNGRVTGAASVSIDSYAGARAMVRHFASCGYRSIAHVAGPPDNFDSHERLRGYRDELAASLPGAPQMVLQGDFSEASGFAAGQALAAREHRPRAVFAANDMMAIGAMSALAAAGLDVPRDVAIAGFDDIPLAAYVRPALTTARVRIADLGRTALELLRRATDDDVPAPGAALPAILLQPEPVIRQSCAAGAPARAQRAPVTRGDP